MTLERTWTAGIHDLMETLTCRVRVLSLQQVQRGWAEVFGSRQAPRLVMERLIKTGLIEGDVWHVPPSPIGDGPLVTWSPGQSCPDLMALETRVQRRWHATPLPTPVIAATQPAARLFGSSTGDLPPENHRNHDLLLASVYIRYRCSQPEFATSWLGEDGIGRAERGVKNPDAFLIDDHGQVVRVVESAGRYSLKQLESFHQHCQRAALAYELW